MRILITAGPTREYIDPVRFISNPSTGTLGFLIAERAKERGYDVIIIAGPCNIPQLKGIKVISVESALEMKNRVEENFQFVDVLIMTAAVSDWRPARVYKQKIKIKKEWNLKLVPNPDILQCISMGRKENQIVVGFALESKNILENAKKKLKKKKVDLIVANPVSNFGNTLKKTEMFLLFSDGRIKKVLCTKKHLAYLLLREVEILVSRKNRTV
ncbi:MAG TPA: phosphopantothenoylcysteine decarboxylase [Candidatus Ratteibacteria bacterium]|jgi:phosphopantothenoylcysteine decarboxylase/phosphopantothenate--cysteine ligase|nr:phosphopantothenoylcysteine decarboxylase [bacterium]HON06258.1 phosphopantothenoylcysteine decarboxylase [bacterium]HRS06900.1 phosphopantothenoylcysteine decarboxylase [Candidatus Ratteibacteria bacterium]HRV04972.1 phosphopantothenoylcysteine decarboxylase [Candidatus Ratteibacteria bacterium]